MQTPMGTAKRPGRQTSNLGCGGISHNPVLAHKAMVLPPRRNVNRDSRHAPQQRHVLVAEASRRMGARAFRVERRCLPNTTPPCMLLRSRQLHVGAHLPPVLQHAQRDATWAATRAHGARPRRYALRLPTTTRKVWETSGTAAMKTSFGDERAREGRNDPLPCRDNEEDRPELHL